MSFVFRSEDNEQGKERVNRFIIELTEYAFKLYPKNRVKVAEYTGISERALRDRLLKYDELKKYSGSRVSDIDDSEKFGIYGKPHLWGRKGEE